MNRFSKGHLSDCLVVGVLCVLFSGGCRKSSDSEPPAAVPKAHSVPTLEAMEPRVAKAIRKAREAAIADPDDAYAWKEYGRVQHAHDLNSEAVSCYRRSLKLDPEDVVTVYLCGIATELMGGAAEEALKLYDRVVDAQPGYPAVYFRRGRLLGSLGRPAEGRHDLERAIEINPALAIAHSVLGQTLLQVGEVERALEHLEQARGIGPDDSKVYAALAQAYGRLGRTDEGRQASAKASIVRTELAIPDEIFFAVRELGVSTLHYYERALRLIEAREFEAAEGPIGDLRTVARGRSDLHVGLAEAFRKQEMTQQVIRHLTEVAAIKKDSARAQSDVGALLFRERRFGDAAKFYQRAAVLSPKSARFQSKLARSLAADHQLAAAIEAFGHAASLGAVDAPTKTDWGLALFRSGATQDAIAQYRGALALQPTLAVAHFNLGLALESLGRRSEAIEAYRTGSVYAPNHPAVQHLEELVRAEGDGE